MNNRFVFFTLLTFSFFLLTNCNQTKKTDMNKELTDFLTEHVNKVSELERNYGIAYFNASISGKDEDYEKAAELEFELEKIYTSKEDFEKIKKFKESGQITDELLNRQLELLYTDYVDKQIDESKVEELINMQSAIENTYSTFRAVVGKDTLTDNQLEELLTSSTDSKKLEQTWRASKEIGKLVANDVIALVKKRNEVAVSLGYDNYHQMSLTLNEQDPKEVEKLFDELDLLTKDAFAKEKDIIDEYFAKRYNIAKEKLMPWHYQNRFFQEAPKIYEIDLDTYYKNQDIVEISRKFYSGIGLQVDSILKNSDLYEKEGKYQHAYCTDIDRSKDVRIVCNIKPNAQWMNTQMHELGHGVYDYYLDMELPYLLREAAHTFTTEAIAMFFGRLASNPQWIQDMTGISDEEKAKISTDCFNTLRLEQLVFSRWAQVMYRFEKGMYENPEQDINKLWWDLVEKYQLLKRPDNNDGAADWASKIHIATVPCYYHNYLLGELFASQLYYYVAENVIKSENVNNMSLTNNKELGNFLKTNIFEQGRRYYWNTMIEKATGEPLTAKYYAMQFVD